MSEPAVHNCLQKKEIFGDLLMKEEFKEDDVPPPVLAEERLDSQEENSAKAASEPVVQDCFQKKLLKDIHQQPEDEEEALQERPSESLKPPKKVQKRGAVDEDPRIAHALSVYYGKR